MKARRKANERRRNVRGKFRALLNNARHVLLPDAYQRLCIVTTCTYNTKKGWDKGAIIVEGPPFNVGCHGKSESQFRINAAGPQEFEIRTVKSHACMPV